MRDQHHLQGERTLLFSGHLAPLKIPKFSGNQTEWQSFDDLFCSLVKNRDYDNVTKVWHLRSALEGDTLDVIISLKITNANFNVAWDLMIKEYENKLTLINAHLDALVSIEPITKESSDQLRTLRNTLRKHLGALTQLDRNTKVYSDILFNRTVALLDPQTKRDWRLSLTSNETMSIYDKFDSFLLDRIKVLHSFKATLPEPTSNSGHATSKQNDQSQSRSVKSHVASSNTVQCTFCKNDHKLFKCPQFRALSLTERFDYVKLNKLCINCLNSNHRVTECKSRKCSNSQQKHNTLLHREQANDTSAERSNSSPNT